MGFCESGPPSEFYTIQGYTVRSCLNKQTNNYYYKEEMGTSSCSPGEEAYSVSELCNIPQGKRVIWVYLKTS